MWGRGRPGLVCCASRCGCQLQTLPSWETQQWEPGAWPPASIQDYLGPCRVGGSVILSGTSHCVCMAVTSRGLAGLLPGPGNLALSLPDERDRVQKKTFTKWVNKHLIKVGGVRARGCERLCRSACVCVCVCVCARAQGLRGRGGCPGRPAQTRAGACSVSTRSGLLSAPGPTSHL